MPNQPQSQDLRACEFLLLLCIVSLAIAGVKPRSAVLLSRGLFSGQLPQSLARGCLNAHRLTADYSIA